MDVAVGAAHAWRVESLLRLGKPRANGRHPRTARATVAPMRLRHVAAAAVSSLVIILSGLTAPAEAASYYGDSARSVARRIGCTDFRHLGGGYLSMDAGKCTLKGYRVKVITFRNRRQDKAWNADVKELFNSDFWWANGRGAVVLHHDGLKPPARIGARRLPGRLAQGRGSQSPRVARSLLDLRL